MKEKEAEGKERRTTWIHEKIQAWILVNRDGRRDAGGKIEKETELVENEGESERRTSVRVL